ncbi:protein Nazo [Anabrus simplex]|uniref:protein Nazo n=1 Tax=Anabrus simplex TaxID=316456 RepID=UPI0035A3AD9B
MSLYSTPSTSTTEKTALLVSKLGELKQIRVLDVNTLIGGLLVGAGAAVGGLLLGPRGLAMGGMMAATAVGTVGQNIILTLADVIRNMDWNRKERLTSLIWKIISTLIKGAAVLSVSALLEKIVTDPKLLSIVKGAVGKFLSGEMNLLMI